jgi:hypothetical protein
VPTGGPSASLQWLTPSAEATPALAGEAADPIADELGCHESQTIATIVWLSRTIHSRMLERMAGARSFMKRCIATGAATPTDASTTKKAIAPACRAAPPPVSAMAAAAATVSRRFLGFTAANPAATAAALAGVNV